MAFNRRLQRYPNPSLKRHHQTAETAAAAYGQFAYRRYPFALSVELFSMDDDYSTSYWLTTPSGSLVYDADIPQVYELVDDDDDLNAIPEWLRPYQRKRKPHTGLRRAFPALSLRPSPTACRLGYESQRHD